MGGRKREGGRSRIHGYVDVMNIWNVEYVGKIAKHIDIEKEREEGQGRKGMQG